MGKRYEVVFAGAGGQGLVLAGSLLGEAAVLYAGLHATTAQAFGVASRGGLARSEVVLSDDEITYPFAIAPNVVIALTGAAWEQMRSRCGHKTMALVDAGAGQVTSPAISVPFVDMAERLGWLQDANMVAVGVAVGLLGVFEGQFAITAAADRFGPDDHRVRAVEAGLKLGHDLSGMSVH